MDEKKLKKKSYFKESILWYENPVYINIYFAHFLFNCIEWHQFWWILGGLIRNSCHYKTAQFLPLLKKQGADWYPAKFQKCSRLSLVQLWPHLLGDDTVRNNQPIVQDNLFDRNSAGRAAEQTLTSQREKQISRCRIWQFSGSWTIGMTYATSNSMLSPEFHRSIKIGRGHTSLVASSLWRKASSRHHYRIEKV